MPIVVIGNEGEAIPGKIDEKVRSRLEYAEKQAVKNSLKPVKRQKKYMETNDLATEEILIKIQKKNPYDIDINLRLAVFYRSHNNWPEAEHHEEIVEWLDRIRRFVESR